MAKAAVAPPAKPLYYVGIDGTDAVDTVAFGQLWRERFGWRNLLLQLKADPADASRRLDSAHPMLPIVAAAKTHGGRTFVDTLIAPEGLDAKGLDAKWPGKKKQDNVASMNAGMAFTQEFIVSPRVDSAKHTLSTSGDVAADILYLSSHGLVNGDMFGENGYHLPGVDYIFSLIRAATSLTPFNGPKWLLLSNCNTLIESTHNDWLALIANPASPLRGILGFRNACPAADGSVSLFASMIESLADGSTMVAAWQKALTDHGLAKHWIALCHEAAAGDTIEAWNRGKLPVIAKLHPPSVRQFHSDAPAGTAVVPVAAPFGVFWSKSGAPITPANRLSPSSKLAPGDQVSITVTPSGGASAFAPGSTVALLLVYIRPTYNQIVDVTKMFDVDPARSSGIELPPTFAPMNPGRFKADAPDTWALTIDGTPAKAVLGLTAKNLDLSGLGHHNVPLWLAAILQEGSAPGLFYKFTRDGAIIVA